MARKNAKLDELAIVKATQGTTAGMDEEGQGIRMDWAEQGSYSRSRASAPQYGLGLSKEERHGVMMDEIRGHLKPDGQFGEGTARLFQHLMQTGNSLNKAGPTVQTTLLYSTGVHVRNELNMTFARKTVKVLALGITKLDGDELVGAILRAPFLCVAADESLRHGDKKYPIFVSFWDVVSGAPWWGAFRVCVMKDKTAETQAQLFYETIVDVLKYPRERVLYVLSDNTASVSGEVGGCVALLQRKLRGEDTTKKTPKTAAAGGGRGGAASRGRGGAALGGRGGAVRGGRIGAARGRGASRGRRGRVVAGGRGMGAGSGSVGADEQG